MDKQDLMRLAEQEGLTGAWIEPARIPLDASFRKYCEENLCGNYGTNYACPPDCGAVEALWARLKAGTQALVLQSVWEIGGYEKQQAVADAKRAHNAALLRVAEALRRANIPHFCLGYGGCTLCQPCCRKENLPCAQPDRQVGCMSAYCIDVGKLAERCGMEFAWAPDKLYLFGMVVLTGCK